jgi:hypothetical protein
MSDKDQLEALRQILRSLDEVGLTLPAIYVSMAIEAFDRSVQPVSGIDIPASPLKH